MADVLLLQPKIGNMDSFRTKPSLPLGLLHAAAFVARDYDVKLIDQRIEGWQSALKRELQKNPLCVATTSMTGPQIKNALEMSRFVRENSGAKIVWGGIHSSLLPEQTLMHRDIDIVIKGEGESTFYYLVNAIKKGLSLKSVKGILYKDNNGKIIANKDREFADLSKMPFLPYGLVNLRDYMPLYHGKRSISIQSSRGCIHNCAYCYNTIFNKGCWRSFSTRRVIEEAKFLMDKGAENLYFVDDNFFVNQERGREIARGMKELGVEWQLQGVTLQSVKGMSNNQIKMLEKSNLKRITLGIETGSERIRHLIGKIGVSAADYIALNKKFSNFGILLFYSFIIGFPTEKEEDRKQTIKLLFKLLKDNKNARNSPIYNFIPYPRTKMLELAKSLGFREPQSLEEWARYEWKNVNVPYISNKEKFTRMYFASIFIDNKFSEYDTLPLIKMLSRVYKHIARFRIKHEFFDFMIEKQIASMIQKDLT